MAVAKGVDRRSEFDTLSDGIAHDFDPEIDEPPTDDESDDDSDSAADSAAGREHYVKTVKSKLQKPKEVRLGPQYRGSKISRDAIIDDDDDGDDPFNKDYDDMDSGVLDENSLRLGGLSAGSDEEDEDEAHGEQEEEQDLEENGDDKASEQSDEDDDAGESDEDEDAEEIDSDMSEAGIEQAPIDRSELRKTMAAEQVAVAGTISAANKADAEKGRAVMRQRATFDALLNTRIKLQKSLIATNSLVALDAAQLDSLRTSREDAIGRAESAAQNLWDTLTSFRDQLQGETTGKKRKATSTSSVAGLLGHLKSQEDAVASQRNAILQKWSMKSRGVSALPQRGRLNNEQPATIVDVLNEHLSNSERLLKRARTPRSCAPVQLASRVSEDEHIYDDADFYGLLLKELLEAKSSASAAAATNVDLSNFANIRREAKTRKNVDTKASKGRKLRYTVHEKLQNYCAPEDRTTWGERQSDELFTSLFGQHAGLNEDKVAEDDATMGDTEDANLIMFKAGLPT